MLIKRQFLCIDEVGKDEKIPFFEKVWTAVCGHKKRKKKSEISKIHEPVLFIT